jgi:hypothetical protein
MSSPPPRFAGGVMSAIRANVIMRETLGATMKDSDSNEN